MRARRASKGSKGCESIVGGGCCCCFFVFFRNFFLFRLRFKLRGTKASTIMKYNTRRSPLRVEETKSDARKGRHERERK